ncbi:MAG: M48 family metallopeptidase, partial [Bacteroidota bacterium]
MKEYKILSGVNPTEYEHPFDRQSLDRLERTRGLDLLTDKVLDHGLEKFLHIKHTGDNVRVESHNIPELHALLIKACQILDMDDLPQLYIHLEDKIQSFSSGEKRRIVVISSGAVDLLTEEELLFLIGREIGHIKSNHVVYRMMAESLQLVSQIISEMTLGIGNLLSMPLKVALMHWYRLSEFTADRAGLLVCQNPEVAGQAFLKMAGLPAK